MPVTAKLSRKFYDTFGDEIADEPVNWFNQVDATYRTDLRELNELNFARFDAKLEQRVAELDAKFSRLLAELEAKFERRLAELDAKFERRLAEVKADLRREIGELRLEMRDIKTELVRWMFLFWAGTTITLLATVVALLKLG